MRRFLLALLLSAAWSAHADATADAAPAPDASALLPPLAVPLVPPGYAFDQPELLVEQRLWGIAHGVRLLARACARHGHVAAAEAWVDWLEREAAELRALNGRLGQYYFGRAEAPLDAIAAVLGLRQSLDLAPETLKAACDTLGAALALPRYDLKRRREELLAQHREETPKND